MKSSADCHSNVKFSYSTAWLKYIHTFMGFNKKNSEEPKKHWCSCVSRAELSMALLFVFLNTRATPQASLGLKIFDDRFVSVREELGARLCVRAKNIYVRIQSSPGNQLTKSSLHEMQRADKLLNALASYQSCANYVFLSRCSYRTFYWIVGHLCRSSCLCHCRRLLYVGFCQRKRERTL